MLVKTDAKIIPTARSLRSVLSGLSKHPKDDKIVYAEEFTPFLHELLKEQFIRAAIIPTQNPNAYVGMNRDIEKHQEAWTRLGTEFSTDNDGRLTVYTKIAKEWVDRVLTQDEIDSMPPLQVEALSRILQAVPRRDREREENENPTAVMMAGMRNEPKFTRTKTMCANINIAGDGAQILTGPFTRLEDAGYRRFFPDSQNGPGNDTIFNEEDGLGDRIITPEPGDLLLLGEDLYSRHQSKGREPQIVIFGLD